MAGPPFRWELPWLEGVVSHLLQRCVTFSSHKRSSPGEVSLSYGATSPASLITSKTKSGSTNRHDERTGKKTRGAVSQEPRAQPAQLN